MKDMVIVLDQFRQRGVVVHWTDEVFDESTPLGRAMFQLAGVFAELYSRFISTRTKEALARKYNSVLPQSNGMARWYELSEVLKPGAQITDQNIGSTIVALHEGYALNFHQIAQLRYGGRNLPDPCLQLLRRWSKRRVISVYQAAKEGRQVWHRRHRRPPSLKRPHLKGGLARHLESAFKIRAADQWFDGACRSSWPKRYLPSSRAPPNRPPRRIP